MVKKLVAGSDFANTSHARDTACDQTRERSAMLEGPLCMGLSLHTKNTTELRRNGLINRNYGYMDNGSEHTRNDWWPNVNWCVDE